MSKDPIHEIRTRRRVEFADTDMGGSVHFSRFFVFMETAEHEFLRALVGLERFGIAQDLVVGVAQPEPALGATRTESGRARNRRIDIVIKPNPNAQ